MPSQVVKIILINHVRGFKFCLDLFFLILSGLYGNWYGGREGLRQEVKSGLSYANTFVK